ncbi:uncharacterized protein [Apostichopus japonicus]|uniref:uncharacterized protein isoform X2 n=1 Tax=Stichopus japonicus TaxID=307972 RepID=UPI003AB89918
MDMMNPNPLIYLLVISAIVPGTQTQMVTTSTVETMPITNNELTTQVKTPTNVKDMTTQVKTPTNVKDMTTQVKTPTNVKDMTTQVKTPTNGKDETVATPTMNPMEKTSPRNKVTGEAMVPGSTDQTSSTIRATSSLTNDVTVTTLPPEQTANRESALPATPATPNASGPLLVMIIGASAAIIIIIVIITAICLCCICYRNQKSSRHSETTSRVNGVHREDDIIRDHESAGKPTKNTVNTDEKVTMTSNESQPKRNSMRTDSLKGNTNYTYADDDSKSGPYYNSIKSNSSVSEQGSGNIFKRIDPTADNSEEIELNPTMSQYDHVIDVSDGTQNQPREPAPRSALKRNISDPNENLLHQRSQPKPTPRTRLFAPTAEIENESDDTGGNSSQDSPGLPDSPPTSPNRGRHLKFPSKGKGPAGSDQAALLANVIRKSNTHRQVDEEDNDETNRTKYW